MDASSQQKYISGTTTRRNQNFDATGGDNYGDGVEQLNIEIDNGSQQQDMMQQNEEDAYDEHLENQVETHQS
tara:strand:- start:2418 stop:2633 length:216 start_codon:yes stop_codon:yes gene_type:complete